MRQDAADDGKVIKEDGVGFTGGFRFDGQTWTECECDHRPAESEAWTLLLRVLDSDFAIVEYPLSGTAFGSAYLGAPPSPHGGPVLTEADSAREAAALAGLWARREGVGEARRDTKAAEIVGLFATDASREAGGRRDLDDVAEIFAEVKAARLLLALDIPVPEGLPRPDLWPKAARSQTQPT